MNYLDHGYALLKTKLYEWFEAGVSLLPNLFVALLVIIFFFFIARLIRNLGYRVLGRVTGNDPISRFLSQTIAFVIGLLGLIIFLDIINLDKTITSLLAGAGILGLAFSLAFQDVVANFVSSVLVLTRKPFVIGDIIKTNDIFGRVEKINMRATMITVPDGQLAIIPNKKIIEAPIFNYTIFGKRRVEIEVGVGFTEDLRRTLEIARNAIEEKCEIIEGQKPEAFVVKFNDYSIDLMVRFWIKFNAQKDYLESKSQGLAAIQEAFAEHGISIPFPIRMVDFISPVQLKNSDDQTLS